MRAESHKSGKKYDNTISLFRFFKLLNTYPTVLDSRPRK